MEVFVCIQFTEIFHCKCIWNKGFLLKKLPVDFVVLVLSLVYIMIDVLHLNAHKTLPKTL